MQGWQWKLVFTTPKTERRGSISIPGVAGAAIESSTPVRQSALYGQADLFTVTIGVFTGK